MSSMEHYDKQRNANLFISNNANPFLISPYSPNQISQTTGNNIIAADIIKPNTPNATIQVQGVMNFPGGVGSPSRLEINGATVYTDRIYLGGGLGGISWNIQGPPTSGIVGTFNAEDQVIFQGGTALFTEPGGGYSLTVNGTVTTSNIAVTAAEDLGPRVVTGKYLPVVVNGTQYYVPLFV
jgi:hypothetical protein